MKGVITILRQRYEKLSAAILVILVFAALVKGGMTAAVDVISPSGEVILLRGKWNSVSEDPEETNRHVYEYRIPDDCGTKLVLSQESFWCSMDIFLDGEEVYSYEDNYTERGTNRHWIELPEGAAGKMLTMVLTGSRSLVGTTVIGNSYLGEKDAVFFRFFRDNLYALVFGIAALLMSCTMFFGNIYLKCKALDSHYLGGWYTMLFILVAGIWIVTDSQLMQMVTGKTGMISLISFLSFMAMPIFLILFIREILVRKRRILDGLCILYELNMAVCVLLYLFRVVPLFRVLPVTHLLILVSVTFILKYGKEEVRKYDNSEIKSIVVGCEMLAGFCCLALIMFYRNPASRYSYCFAIGIVFFCVCLVAAFFHKIYYYLGRSASIEAYRKMAYLDELTGVANRNAFEKYQKQENLPAKLAFLIFDVNNLKMINDRYGHKEGDRVIQDVAESIREGFDRIGKCYRIGGDEFIVSIPETSGKEIEQSIAQWEKILERINKSRGFPMKIAWGYAVREGVDVLVEELFAEADANMYRRKAEMKERESG